MAEDEWGSWIPDEEVPDSIKKTSSYRQQQQQEKQQRSDKDKRIHWFEDHPEDRYRGGAPKEIYLEITIDDLAKTFNVCPRTIYKWIKNKILDPSDLLKIVELYHSRHKENSNVPLPIV